MCFRLERELLVDNELFRDLYEYYMEIGEDGEKALKYFLALMNTYGYRLDVGLLTLDVDSADVTANEIRLDCKYPINHINRIDPKTGKQVMLCNEDGDYDENFFVSIVPFDTRKETKEA